MAPGAIAAGLQFRFSDTDVESGLQGTAMPSCLPP
jgi:hypothetical protein